MTSPSLSLSFSLSESARAQKLSRRKHSIPRVACCFPGLTLVLRWKVSGIICLGRDPGGFCQLLLKSQSWLRPVCMWAAHSNAMGPPQTNCPPIPSRSEAHKAHGRPYEEPDSSLCLIQRVFQGRQCKPHKSTHPVLPILLPLFISPVQRQSRQH